MLDRRLTNRIRSIFLHDEQRVTIETGADLLGWTAAEMRAAVERGEIETLPGPDGWRIDLREIAETALHLWPMTVIEEALGTDASLVLPPSVRTGMFAVRLPRYVIAAMRYLAEENGESVDAFLARELHGIAYEERERLAAAIPGFAEAVDWPFSEAAVAAC